MRSVAKQTVTSIEALSGSIDRINGSASGIPAAAHQELEAAGEMKPKYFRSLPQ